MKIVSCGKYKCPYCGTVVELAKNDIQIWDDVTYYKCPVCLRTPHIRGGNKWCPLFIEGKKAIRVD